MFIVNKNTKHPRRPAECWENQQATVKEYKTKIFFDPMQSWNKK